jgi:hypothetical protein
VDVVVNRNGAFFEEMVPGFLEQISHRTAWNVPSRSSNGA